MPARVPFTDPHNTPAEVVLSLSLSGEDLSRFTEMVGAFVHGEYELAEDLMALGEPVDEPLARAALGIRLLAAAAGATPGH